MSDTGNLKRERVDELLRKSLLGEELVNTQFHLFSARSSPSQRVLKPRVLCANDVLLAKGSKYFLDLLSADVDPSDPSLVDLANEDDVPNDALIEAYGYESDSDLDECTDAVPVATPKAQKNSASKDDDESSDDGSGSVNSDVFVLSPEQPPREDDPLSGIKGPLGSRASSETAVQDVAGNKASGNQTAVRLRSLGSRHVLVNDTAFQTWYTLLNYLYTDKFSFLPLSSAGAGVQPRESLTNSVDEPRCSAKSMYRLACKVGLDHLRDEAFSYLRRNLTEHNVLDELSCSLLSRHAELREMALDVLYAHIASPSVVAGFSAFATRIANGELAHGADVVVGIHARMLQASRRAVPEPTRPVVLPALGPEPEQVKAADASPGTRGRPASVDTPPTEAPAPASKSSMSAPVPFPASPTRSVPSARFGASARKSTRI